MNYSLYAMLHVFDERARADNTNIDSEKNKTIVNRHLIYLFLSFDDTIIAFRDRNVKWFLAKNGKNFALALYCDKVRAGTPHTRSTVQEKERGSPLPPLIHFAAGLNCEIFNIPQVELAIGLIIIHRSTCRE